MNANHIVKEVLQERERQTNKWGAAADDNWNPLDWHEMIADYNGWARRMLCQGSPDKGRRRLIQIAALAVAQIEALDRRFPGLTLPDSIFPE